PALRAGRSRRSERTHPSGPRALSRDDGKPGQPRGSVAAVASQRGDRPGHGRCLLASAGASGERRAACGVRGRRTRGRGRGLLDALVMTTSRGVIAHTLALRASNLRRLRGRGMSTIEMLVAGARCREMQSSDTRTTLKALCEAVSVDETLSLVRT